MNNHSQQIRSRASESVQSKKSFAYSFANNIKYQKINQKPTLIPRPGKNILDTSSSNLKNGLNRCPKCGSSEIGQKMGTDVLVCLYCHNKWQGIKIEEELGLGENIEKLKGTVVALGAQDISADAQNLMSFKCGGCGAEVSINTQNAMTARCHWCRHTLGLNQQVANGAVPDAVLPFRVKKEVAIQLIRDFVAQRERYVLWDFKNQFKPENVVGVYLPYMVVDINASAEFSGEGEIETNRYTKGSGSNEETFYDADIYDVYRHIDFEVNDLSLESTSKHRQIDSRLRTNNIINSILPFDTQNAVKWNASYLSGFTSEKRNLNIEHLQNQLEDQLLTMARSEVYTSLAKYDRGVRWDYERINIQGTRWVSMYLPVWIYSYREKRRSGSVVHYIAVNGRTAEIMGSVPVNEWKLFFVTAFFCLTIQALGIFILGKV